MINDIPNVDILGSWRPEEVYFKKFLENAIKVYLLCLEPYWSKNPWSRALEGKHVLVVHPFAEDIINQYKNHREQLFEDKGVLPKFASLRVVKAVQSIGGESNGFQDWFEALDWMKTEMDKAVQYVIYRFAKGERVDLSDPSHIVAITRDTYYNLHFSVEPGQYTYVVTALDRLHNESKLAKKKLKL